MFFPFTSYSVFERTIHKKDEIFFVYCKRRRGVLGVHAEQHGKMKLTVCDSRTQISVVRTYHRTSFEPWHLWAFQIWYEFPKLQISREGAHRHFPPSWLQQTGKKMTPRESECCFFWDSLYTKVGEENTTGVDTCVSHCLSLIVDHLWLQAEPQELLIWSYIHLSSLFYLSLWVSGNLHVEAGLFHWKPHRVLISMFPALRHVLLCP